MKNIYLIPTEKPSKLRYNLSNVLVFTKESYRDYGKEANQHIYITSEKEIKEGVEQWYLDKVLNEPYNSGGAQYSSKQDVIILTTDQDLIKDGVQSVEEDFLYWFVKNPSCEEVKIENVFGFAEIIIPKEQQKQHLIDMMKVDEELGLYEETIATEEDAKIFVDNIENPPAPNEKLKTAFEKQLNKETLEEYAERIAENFKNVDFKAGVIYGVIEGAKLQEKRMYSEEEVIAFVKWMYDYKADINKVEELFKQFKKK